MKESDVAEVVVNWLESKDWDVYQEVQFRPGSSIADIVAVKDEQMWIIETKISLGFAVLAQAKYWRCHYRSIAVLRSRRGGSVGRQLAYDVCRNYLGVGIMEVLPSDSDIWVVVAPQLQEGIDGFVENQRRILSPLHKTFAKAGSSGSGHLTPYKETMLEIREFIGSHPGCTLAEIIGYVGRAHYAHEASAKNGIRTALRDWEDWAVIDRQSGHYGYRLKDRETAGVAG